MARKNYVAKYQARVTFIVDGRDCGVWNKRTGAAKDSSETKVNPGGMEEEVSMGGKPSYDNATLEKPYAHEDRELADFLDDRAGKGVAQIIHQPLDADGNAFGKPFTWVGTLKKFEPPEHDADAEDDVATMSCECSITGKG